MVAARAELSVGPLPPALRSRVARTLGELDALRGMARSLERTRPRLLAVEMYEPHLVAARATEEEIVALLCDLGYERERTIGENAILRLRSAEPVPATARVEHALARLARSRKLRSPQVVAVGSSFLGIAAFWLTASLVEAFTDRDWTLSGMEWPADFVTAGLLVCLVPPVLLGVQLLLNAVARRRVEPAHLRAARAVRRSSSTDG